MTSGALSQLSTRRSDGLIVLDGHDGAGKSTLLQRLAHQLGGCVVKPFRDSLGDLMVWLIESREYELANRLALQAVAKGKQENPGDGLRWFDRHWLSLFTLLPETYYDSWMPLPPTILCWADPEVTVRRLAERGESPGDMEHHRYFCRRYIELAERFGVPIIDTSETTAELAAGRVMEWLL